MAWDSDALDILRVLLYDLDEANQRFTDDYLLSAAITAARQVISEVDFDTTYTVSISAQSIIPDPAADESFMNLLTLKVACIAERGLAAVAANQAIAIKDDKSAVDLRGIAQARLEILKNGGWCAAYAEAKKEHLLAQAGVSRTGATTAGQAILSPFRLYARNQIWGRYHGDRLSG